MLVARETKHVLNTRIKLFPLAYKLSLVEKLFELRPEIENGTKIYAELNLDHQRNICI